jgi:type I restriction enzyme M protein
LKKAEFKDRYSFGYPNNNSADWAWVQHMLASANQNGRVGIVVDNGCLFRGRIEGDIRTTILSERNDFIETVILLPEKLFYNTIAPGAIIIFNLSKREERKKKVLFINASKEAEQHSEVRKLNRLSDDNIKKITDAYEHFSEVPGFSRIVGLEEIDSNGWNLNVTPYVMPNEETEKINVVQEFSGILSLEMERQEIIKKLENYIAQLSQAIEDN